MIEIERKTDLPSFERRAFLALAAFSAAAYAAGGGGSAMRSEIVALDAHGLAAAIRQKQVSCVEVVAAYLEQIECFNPQVNAIVALQERDELMAQARARDASLARGERVGLLHGFPHAVKDLQATRGITTTQGSPLFRHFVPKSDSIMVERLRRAGAVLIGKTNVPEFGLGSQTYNTVYGATRNAYDQTRTAGGSSGGAAVAVALRMVPVADGSDWGGSLRNPAGWNNVFGFRPSIGRVPTARADLWLPSMGVDGPIARTVPDLAMLLAVQSGYDDRVPLSIDTDLIRLTQKLDRNFKGARIAWISDFGGYLPFEPGVLEVCRKALHSFGDLGCSVEEASPDYPIDDVWRACITLRSWQNGSGLVDAYTDSAQRALLKPEAIFEVESGAKLSAYDISAASEVRSRWYLAVREFFRKYDFAVLPTAQVFPFSIDVHWPDEIAGKRMANYYEWMKVAMLITMSGCPAAAAPAGFSSHGLPIGMQIVGPNHSDLACLQLAHAYDRARGGASNVVPPLLRA